MAYASICYYATAYYYMIAYAVIFYDAMPHDATGWLVIVDDVALLYYVMRFRAQSHSTV